ncbi:MAG: ATP-binding cassette domain-containing protein [Chitinophagaceae bacterium]|nr:ATP-binding cassette domain-containing protein [Chitinophagaceae bacterium]
MLIISNYQKQYPGTDTPVLSITKLELAAGCYWIKGENGSGKTSLIKSIAGLLPCTGEIAVNGLNIRNNRMGYTKIVYYAEAEPQYPGFLTGKELMDFYFATKKGHLPHKLIKGLGVDQFMNSKTAVYSSGMMKKLSLVLGFTGNPALILLDEPLIALDAAAVDTLQHTITAYCNQGISFIVTSHQPLDNSIVKVDAGFIIKDKTLLKENQ